MENIIQFPLKGSAEATLIQLGCLTKKLREIPVDEIRAVEIIDEQGLIKHGGSAIKDIVIVLCRIGLEVT